MIVKASMLGATFFLAAIYSPIIAQDKEPLDPTVEALLRSMGMMSEKQIAQFFKQVDGRERINALLASGDAEGKPRTIEIDFLRKVGSQKINLASNRVTAIEIMDQNGNAWPLTEFLPAPEGSLDVQKIGDSGSVIGVIVKSGVLGFHQAAFRLF